MTKRIVPLAFIAVLMLSLAPPAAAQVGSAGFEPGINSPGDEGPRGRRAPGRHSWGRAPRFEGRGPMLGGPGPGRLGMALRRLDLSEGQREEIRAIFENERGLVQANHEDMRTLSAELEGQIEADPYDEEAIRAKAGGLAELRVEMAVLRARQLGQIREVLTPEQVDELQQMKSERKEFRDRRRERFQRFQLGEEPLSGAG